MFLPFLLAREARQAAIEQACRESGGGAIVFASTNVPGPGKWPPGIAGWFGDACEAVASRLPATRRGAGTDAVGPWALFAAAMPPSEVKRAAIRLEQELPAGRLLDLDVYSPGGHQADRASLGLPPRACLVCDLPAVECIRTKRHEAATLARAVAGLLSAWPRRRLAGLLVEGARRELALTPKPGLVDLRDNGSHPDLSFALMTASIDLLPEYFDDLERAAPPGPAGSMTAEADLLDGCVAAGIRAERRMVERVGTNTHKGYIFLSGLTLLASGAGADRMRDEIARLAGRLVGNRPSGGSSHGALVRAGHGLGGVVREALNGLPSVFEHGLPALRSARLERAGAGAPLHRAMAVLMQVVEDTTAVHRCGLEGLDRLRADGRRLQELIDEGRAYSRWLEELNDDYRRLGLTMGGVADCLALTVALDLFLPES
jgi:holo-ACP synthase CitX